MWYTKGINFLKYNYTKGINFLKYNSLLVSLVWDFERTLNRGTGPLYQKNLGPELSWTPGYHGCGLRAYGRCTHLGFDLIQIHNIQNGSDTFSPHMIGASSPSLSSVKVKKYFKYLAWLSFNYCSYCLERLQQSAEQRCYWSLQWDWLQCIFSKHLQLFARIKLWKK
jgi:hypothetical protein